MPALNPQIKTIFASALEIESDEARRVYLDQACGADSALRRELDTLLTAYQAAPAFFARAAPTVNKAGTPVDVAGTDTQVGPYTLREQLGEGGMGVVYVAEQSEPVKRKVALKIIKPGMDSQQVIARFEAERQALAMMDHPNIARIIDAGTTDAGRSYFVMELVYGIPITEYCDERRLSTNERLGLFVKVCRAVQHAHQKGVIHRDLKPSNVLVGTIDGEAIPKVIDFGVAKAAGPQLTGKPVYTQFSQIVGTPLYMSPEQAELGVADVDTRSDVYALGVVLYELLTGNTPFDNETLKHAGFDEMRRIIREDEPPQPSAMVSTLRAEALSTVSQRRGCDPRKLSDSLAGELDWLAMKALEKDRNRRYDSASALAADIQRYLDGEAIEACPPSRMYRWRKLARRHKVALVTATAVLATLLLGIAGTTWQAWRATANRILAESEREKASLNFRRARDTVDTLLAMTEKNELLQDPTMQPLRDELMETARQYYRQFVGDAQTDSETTDDLVKAYLQLGDIAWQLGQYEDAKEADRSAIEIRKELVAAQPDNQEHRHKLAATYLAIADIPHTSQIEHLRSAVEAAKMLKEGTHRDVLAEAYLQLGRALLREFLEGAGIQQSLREGLSAAEKAEALFEQLRQYQPDHADYQRAIAEAYLLLARYRWHENGMDDAKDYYERSLSVLETLVTTHPGNDEYRWLLVEGYQSYGQTQKALDLLQGLVEKHPNIARYQVKLVQLYYALADSEDYAIEQAVAAANKLVMRYPKNVQHRGQLGFCLAALGESQFKADKYEQAVESFQSAITQLVALKPYQIGKLSDTYESLTKAYQTAGNLDKALAASKEEIEADRELVTRNPRNPRFVAARSRALLRFASLLKRTGRIEDALAEAQRAALLQETFINDRRQDDVTAENIIQSYAALADCYRDVAQYQHALGKHTEAADAYRSALAAQAQMIRVAPRTWWYNSPNPLYHGYLSAARNAGIPRDQVEDVLRNELATWRELQGVQETVGADCAKSCQIRQLEITLRLAAWLTESKQDDKAGDCYREATAMLGQLDDAESKWLARTVSTVIHVCDARSDVETATNAQRAQFLKRIDDYLPSALSAARSICESKPDDVVLAWAVDAWSDLAISYYGRKQWEGSESDGRLAIQLGPDRIGDLPKMAPLLLLSGELEEYQSLCDQLLANETRFWNHDYLRNALALCLLDPKPVRPERLLQLATQVSADTSDDYLLSVAYYRASDPQRAIDGLLSLRTSASDEKPLIELHLAIAHGLAGQPDEARRWLDAAVGNRQVIDLPAKKLAYEVLRQQAEQLLSIAVRPPSNSLPLRDGAE
jgi:serine/threonine protein kinase